jgi:hypothetical protein
MNETLNLYKIRRKLRQEERRIYHLLHSIKEDSEFVESVLRQFSSFSSNRINE